MKTELEMNEYVPFIRKWVKQTVDMMSIEEIKSMAMAIPMETQYVRVFWIRQQTQMICVNVEVKPTDI